MMENMPAIHYTKSETKSLRLISEDTQPISQFIKNNLIIAPLSNRFASGYAWRGVNLTRQDLLCLLIFSQEMDNTNTAKILGIAPHTLHKRSSNLRRKLGFKNKRAMVSASQQAEFSTTLPSTLIDSLFDELKQRRNL